ncbi:ATP-binding mismatch repair protein [Cryptotrichosporon argae]
MAASIKAIDATSVHRIHAGQVVLDLQGAVKELVENSLDAGASIIEVRIREHGLGGVEVVDNGSGISEGDWASIGLKHHTSKLPSLAKLPQVATFGFRGEALASLCALCEGVVVTTATKETAPMGAVIRLGRDGRVLDANGRVARQRGTTVALTGLFTPLPVRRKEYESNAKREFAKTLAVLTAYALVPSSAGRGVRLKVDSIAGKTEKRSTVLVTDGKGSLRSAATAVWGPKALEGVVDVALDLDVEVDRAMARREGVSEASQPVRVTGLISSAAWGQGRASADRQFFYINGRPCALAKVAKAVNDVYKSFNTHQLPFAVLDFTISKESVDINVSPDKRTIFVHSEANLVDALRAALDAFWAPARSAFAVSGASQAGRLVQRDLHGFASQLQASQAGADGEEELDASADQAGGDSADDGDEVGVSESEPSASTARPARPASSPEPHVQAGPSRTRSAPQPTARRPTQTIDTTRASWSAARRATPSQAAAPSDAAPSTGRTARSALRERLRVYASQGAMGHNVDGEDSGEDVEVGDEAEDGDGHAGEAAVDRDALGDGETERGEGQGEEGADEIRSYEDDGGGQPGDGSASTRVAEVQTTAGVSDATSPARSSTATRGSITIEDVGWQAARGKAQPDGVDAADDLASTRADDWETTPSPHERIRSVAEPVFADEAAPSEAEDAAEKGNDVVRRTGEGRDDTAYARSDYTDAPSSPGPLLARPPSSPPRPASRDAYRGEIQSTALQGEATLAFDLARLRRRYARLCAPARAPVATAAAAASAYARMQGAATAGVGADAGQAEAALARVISKPDFARMDVLGQFNKGFIIARLRGTGTGGSGKGADDADGQGEDEGGEEDDLFIIDQHASDEKFNFETLQRTTVIEAQALIRPRPLQLTAADELVALEHLDVLRANGFDVVVDDAAAPGRGARVSLAAMPVSKDTVFDFKDLEQLLHLLSDGARPAGQMVRCAKARAMFASRACRKSVMIGKSLTRAQMAQLLRNMGSIDQPWNCPHGRPTMRHLHTMDRPARGAERERPIEWARWNAARAG